MSPRAKRGLRIAGTAVLALLIVAAVIDELTPASSGPTSSSYATSPDGLAAYADLLTAAGHDVTRLRVTPARATLDPRGTVVLLDPNLVLQSDVAALRRFVQAGGWLIAGGREPGAWLSELIADSPTWIATGATSPTTLVPVASTAGVDVVQTTGAGSWSDPGGTLPVIGEPRSSLLTVATLGTGRIELLADSSPLQNQLLAHADNARLGLSLAGAAGRTVQFEEASHGYGGGRGLGALPPRWKWALIGLLVAALLAVASRIRRLGPATPPAPPTPPPRRAHVEALASALARAERPSRAAEPVRDHVRALVLRRAGLPVTADESELTEAAEQLGLSPDEVRAVVAEHLADADVLAAGRALAKLSGTPS